MSDGWRPEDKIKVVYVGMNFPAKYRNYRFTFERLRNKRPFIGTIARFSKEKGLERFIMAMPLILKDLPEAKFILMGKGEEEGNIMSLIEKFGLKDIKVYVMCEIPSNVIMVDKFLDVFDGMSIGSNDLTQLSLGIDRDNARIAHMTNEMDPTVIKMITTVIKACQKRNKYVGICGQGPSDIPEFAEFLQKQGIESMSLNPDTIIKTILALSKK